MDEGRTWDYAVAAGDRITDRFPLDLFDSGMYHLCVCGPNGFFRDFRGHRDDPGLAVSLTSAADGAVLKLINHDPARPLNVTVEDQSYGASPRALHVSPGAVSVVRLNLNRSHGWYDLRICVAGSPDYEQRYAGHVETGRESFTDPLIA